MTAFVLIFGTAGYLLLFRSFAATSVKGDVNTSTVEQRLLTDPNVLWVGTGDNANWKANFGFTKEVKASNASQVTPPTSWRGKAIQIRNPGPHNPMIWDDRWGYSGFADFTQMGIGKHEELYLRYYVWVPANLSRQGKLPGLQGLVDGGTVDELGVSVPCQTVYSYVVPGHDWYDKDCFNRRRFGTRTMWKWFDSNPANIGMIAYLGAISGAGQVSDNNRTETFDNYGIEPRYRDPLGSTTNARLNKGAWNYVEQHVKLNTPGQKNGVFEGWINGKKALDIRDMYYRDSEHASMKITHWELVAFWGGPMADFPTEPTNWYFDDIVISKAYIGARSDTVTPPTPPTTPTAPDLVVTSITTDPANPIAGQPIKFTATIKNNGTASTPVTCRSSTTGCIHGVAFTINGDFVAWSDDSTTSLAPGASRTVTSNGGPNNSNGSWTGVAGNYELGAVVDIVGGDDRIDESNETNNTLVKTVTVGAGTTYRSEDINQDGSVNLLDFSLLSVKYGQAGSTLGRADINSDNVVNLIDFSLLSAKFGS